VENPKDAWLKGEPTLEEVIADPIIHLVLQRSGLSIRGLREVILKAARKLPDIERVKASIKLPQGSLAGRPNQESLMLSREVHNCGAAL